MIRQAISCDVCGAEKRQTNHWFVAYKHGDELRVTGWNANSRMRTGCKHLCGQTCLHKLVDEFIAGTVAARASHAADNGLREETIAATEPSLTSSAAYAAPAATVPPVPPLRSLQVVPAALVAIAPTRAIPPQRAAAPPCAIDEPAPPPFDDTPNYGSRRWRAEAWERERERCSALGSHRKTS